MENYKLKKIGSVLLFVLPAFVPLSVFWLYPICKAIWMSFTNSDFMSPAFNYVAFDNYIAVFHDSRFYEALLNTLVFTVGTLRSFWGYCWPWPFQGNSAGPSF